jgi:Lrp/AsnC family transcriptional regulator, leucine-responsive regulatory protein
MKSLALDAIDIKILNEMQNDATLTNVELASRVNLSPSPCLSRVKALEKAGFIDRCVALLNPAALGIFVDAFIHVKLEKQNAAANDKFSAAVGRMTEVLDIYLMASDCEFLLRVALRDIDELERVVNRIARLEDVLTVKPSIVLKNLQRTTALPLSIGEAANINGHAQRYCSARGERQVASTR